MKILILNEKEMEKIMPMSEAIEADKEALEIYSEGGAEIPLRTNINIPEHQGQSLYMPGYASKSNALGVKIVSVYPKNIEKGLNSVPAGMILLDSSTGMINCIMDGTFLTKLRTGAVSGAATELLSRKNSKVFLLIGTGGQAESQLEAVLNVRDIEETYVCDISLERARDFAKKMTEKLGDKFKTKIIPVDNADSIVPTADIITTVTTSKKAVFDGNLLKDGTHINAIGSYTPDMQELPESALLKANLIYVDTKDGVLNESGDFIKPINSGKFNVEKDLTGELGELISGKIIGRTDDSQITVFESTGTAVLDVVVARKIYEKALILKTFGTYIEI